jgi:hypothetical protein
MRSPIFPSLDHKSLWIKRTRDLALNNIEKAVVEGGINAMTDEEVTAALASIRHEETSSVLEDGRVEVLDPPLSMQARVPKLVIVTDDDNDVPTDRYSMPFTGVTNPDVPVRPYVSPQRPPLRFDQPVPGLSRDSVPRDSVPHDFRESTTDSVRARRTPIPTIESQTKPPAKFKSEEMSFVKVDVFLKKMERSNQLRASLSLSIFAISPRFLEISKLGLCSIPGRGIRQDGLLQRRLHPMQPLLHW